MNRVSHCSASKALCVIADKPSKWAATIFLLSMGGVAHANTCPIANGTMTINMPTSVQAARDAPNGTLLTSWAEISDTQYYYNCSNTTEQGRWGIWFVWTGTDSAGFAIKSDGIDVTVYKTNVEGVGVAIKVKGYSQHCGSSEWSAWYSVAVSGWVCVPTKKGYWQGGARVAVALVKTGPVSPGKVSVGTPFYSYLVLNEIWRWGGSNYYYYHKISDTKVTVGACQTPDVAVNLGNHPASELTAVGSRTTPVKFELQINDCPKNLASVRYGFNFSGKDYKPAEGIVGLTSASTAKGVKVKLMNSAGTQAVKLDEWMSLTDYKSATGGSYKVALSAAYERTSDLAPGSANAEMIIAMEYR